MNEILVKSLILLSILIVIVLGSGFFIYLSVNDTEENRALNQTENETGIYYGDGVYTVEEGNTIITDNGFEIKIENIYTQYCTPRSDVGKNCYSFYQDGTKEIKYVKLHFDSREFTLEEGESRNYSASVMVRNDVLKLTAEKIVDSNQSFATVSVTSI